MCDAARARLRWELELRTKGHEVVQKAARGAPVPQWFMDEPIASDGMLILSEAFWELTTERQVGMALGEIPGSQIVAYAERKGVSAAMMGLFKDAIRAMDDTYLGWVEHRRQVAQKSGKGKTSG